MVVVCQWEVSREVQFQGGWSRCRYAARLLRAWSVALPRDVVNFSSRQRSCLPRHQHSALQLQQRIEL
jgi:hypothetical protein